MTMKNIKQALLISAASICLLFFSCEKDDSPSPIPTTPNSFFPPNGEVISGTEIELNASGSKVDNKDDIVYDYYFGEDTANMVESFGLLSELTPGTKYYWKVVPHTLDDEFYYGESSEIFHFYTQPLPLSGLESDNCEGQTGIILRWDEQDNYKEVKITFSPEDKNVDQPIIIPAGQDSCVLTGLLDAAPDTKEYIKYTFHVEPMVLATDKEMAAEADTISEISLNKSYNVRDIDFNVYRLITIGDQVWMRDNLRVTRLNDGTELIEGEEYVIGSESDKYGLYYHFDAFSDGHSDWETGKWKVRPIAPKGFKVAEWDDWVELFKFLGADKDDFDFNPYGLDEDYYMLNEYGAGQVLKSKSGWEPVNGNDGNGTDFYGLTILPGGFIDTETLTEHGIGQLSYLYASQNHVGYLNHSIINFRSSHKGVFYTKHSSIPAFANLRCIKEK
jgi:uncharacterized protein (TIGR02145 family)